MTIKIQNISEVVKNNFCIGCGTCSAIDNRITIKENNYGELIADLSKASNQGLSRASKVCPFSTQKLETEIAGDLFGELEYNEKLGFYDTLLAGYSIDSRTTGSSGGVITHVLKELLEQDLVDFVIAVRQKTNDSTRGIEFSFDVTPSLDELSKFGTSFYYPVTYEEVLQFIKETPGRYAITGVPCFHKSLRLLRAEEPIFNERIKYQIGLVCGQMKSKQYFEYLLRKTGVKGTVSSASFRRKNLDGKASEYYFEAVDDNNRKHLLSNKEIGANWGMGYFKPKACDYCDDVFAETADIAVMDAWLPKYVDDGQGCSIIIIRDKSLTSLISKSTTEGHMHMENIELSEVINSQLGGLTHRHAGLSYRLSLATGDIPKKRINPSKKHTFIFKIEQIVRLILRKSSRQLLPIQRKISSGILFFEIVMMPAVTLLKIIGRVKRKVYLRNKNRNL